MSNPMVGTVYQKIMEEVINGCVVTFEEDGVDKKLLEEVKATWQAKLTERNVALMPWDPAPALTPQQQGPASNSTPANRQQPSVPSSAPQQPSSGPPQAQQAPAHNANNGVQIKSEPSTGYDLKNLPPVAPIAARDRAKALVDERFSSSNQGSGQRAMTEDERRRINLQIASNTSKMQGQMNQRSSLGNAQTDGADGWTSMVAERRVAALEDGSAADASLKQRIEAMSQTMEAGGLMAPLSEAQKRGKGTDTMSEHLRAQMTVVRAGHGQTDGPGDSEDDKTGIKSDEDEDAINSDLDDPDDDQPEDTEEDANNGEFMLCTYDKVQRVKNKWKCTLKDGVLATGGKEYVFHKAQGEFEW